MKLCSILVALYLFLALPAFSQSSADTEFVIFDSILELNFEPHEAFFLIDFGGGDIRRFSATILPSSTPEDEAGQTPEHETWLFGVMTHAPQGSRSVAYSLVVAGDNGQLYLDPPRQKTLMGQKVNEALHQESERARRESMEELRSLSVERRLREADLVRLEKDAVVIGSFARVIDIRNELAAVRHELENTKKDISNLESFLRIVDEEEAPPGFQRRENDLARQLRELASVAREAESRELDRKGGRQERLSEYEDMIALARNENVERLQSELGNLRRHRIQLERGLPVADVPTGEAESTSYFDLGEY